MLWGLEKWDTLFPTKVSNFFFFWGRRYNFVYRYILFCFIICDSKLLDTCKESCSVKPKRKLAKRESLSLHTRLFSYKSVSDRLKLDHCPSLNINILKYTYNYKQICKYTYSSVYDLILWCISFFCWHHPMNGAYPWAVLSPKFMTIFNNMVKFFRYLWISFYHQITDLRWSPFIYAEYIYIYLLHPFACIFLMILFTNRCKQADLFRFIYEQKHKWFKRVRSSHNIYCDGYFPIIIILL